MLKRFTSPALLSLLLSACSSVPGPFNGSADSASVQTDQVPDSAYGAVEQTDGLIEMPAPLVAVPPLQKGKQALFDRAVQLLKNRQLSAAEVLFAELTDSQPELAGPWVNLGHIYLAQERGEEALQAFEQALAANPASCDAHNQLGVLARREGRFADAEQHYLQCLQINPGYSPAQLNLGILYELYMGRLGEALAAYHDYQVIQGEPDARVNGWVMDLERRVAAIAKR